MKKTICLLFLPLLLTCCALNDNSKTPLGWCIWEIRKHEGYEHCKCIVQDGFPLDDEKENNNNVLDSYIITTYTDEYRTEWCCSIEYSYTMKKYLDAKDIIAIDCDIIWELKL